MFTQCNDKNVQAAKLYAWLQQRLGRRVPGWAYEIGALTTTTDERAAKRLAAMMTEFGGEIPLQARGVSLGDILIESHLRTWWFDYRTKKKDEEIRKRGLAKLDPDERRVLGLA